MTGTVIPILVGLLVYGMEALYEISPSAIAGPILGFFLLVYVICLFFSPTLRETSLAALNAIATCDTACLRRATSLTRKSSVMAVQDALNGSSAVTPTEVLDLDASSGAGGGGDDRALALQPQAEEAEATLGVSPPTAFSLDPAPAPRPSLLTRAMGSVKNMGRASVSSPEAGTESVPPSSQQSGGLTPAPFARTASHTSVLSNPRASLAGGPAPEPATTSTTSPRGQQTRPSFSPSSITSTDPVHPDEPPSPTRQSLVVRGFRDLLAAVPVLGPTPDVTSEDVLSISTSEGALSISSSSGGSRRSRPSFAPPMIRTSSTRGSDALGTSGLMSREQMTDDNEEKENQT